MAKKFGLGNGLDSLLGSSAKEDEPAKTENSFQSVKTNLPAGIEQDEFGKLWINPELLRPNPYQPRQEFDPEQLKELSDSIKENGVIQPVTIEDAKDGTFYIIAGERRTRASRLAGLEKIPVQLSAFSDQKKLEVALIENIQRADLNPVEEARAYYKLMELGGLKQEESRQKSRHCCKRNPPPKTSGRHSECACWRTNYRRTRARSFNGKGQNEYAHFVRKNRRPGTFCSSDGSYGIGNQ